MFLRGDLLRGIPLFRPETVTNTVLCSATRERTALVGRVVVASRAQERAGGGLQRDAGAPASPGITCATRGIAPSWAGSRPRRGRQSAGCGRIRIRRSRLCIVSGRVASAAQGLRTRGGASRDRSDGRWRGRKKDNQKRCASYDFDGFIQRLGVFAKALDSARSWVSVQYEFGGYDDYSEEKDKQESTVF